MKILYIHQHFALPSEGGGGRPYQFARRLASDGHEVLMLCSGDQALDQELDGFAVKRLRVPYRNEMSVPRRLLAFTDFMVKATAFIIKSRPDLIFASSTPLTVAIPALVAKRVHRVPLVFEVRDLWPLIPIEMGFLTNPVLKKVALILEKVTYKSADRIVALSPGMADGVKAVHPEAAVTVIPNASDIELFDKDEEFRTAFRAEEGWAAEETVIVYAGGFGKVYSLDWVVQLAAELENDLISIVMIGQGSESERLKSLAEDLGLDASKIFLGKKSRAEVADYVSAADLVLSSSRLDPCLEPASLNKVFDGLAAGRPILLNHAGWLTEAVVENEAGWKLDRNVSLAAEEVRSIAQDDSLTSQARVNSRNLAAKSFERDLLYKKFKKVIEEWS